MFDPLPEKPSVFAYHWLLLFGCAGGGVGVVTAGAIFGSGFLETSNAGAIASFMVGAAAGVGAGWKLIMPSHDP